MAEQTKKSTLFEDDKKSTKKAVAEEPKQAEKAAVNQKSVKVVAVQRPIRCPMSGIMYTINKPVDIIDISAKDNSWVANQLAAGVLKQV